jgi:hypothetical protein
MNQVIQFVKSEPALLAALVTIAVTLSASIPAQQGTLGLILSAVQALLAVVVRSQVTPTAKLGIAPGVTVVPPK